MRPDARRITFKGAPGRDRPREEARNINDSPRALRRDRGLCNRFGQTAPPQPHVLRHHGRRGPIVRDDRGAPPLHAPELHRREESDAPCPRIARDVSQHLALPEIMRHDIFRRSRRKGRGRGQWSPPPSCSRTWGTSGPTTSTASLTPPREPGALTTRAPVASREVTPTSPRDRPDSGVLVSP